VGVKATLLVLAVVMSQSVLAADVVITNSIVRDAVAKVLKKPAGKFAPPPKFTKAELASVRHLNLEDTKITLKYNVCWIIRRTFHEQIP